MELRPIQQNKMQFFSKQQLCPYYYKDAPNGHWLSASIKSLMAIARECYELYWTIPGSNIPWNRSLLPSISKTIQIRWTRHAVHSWRSKDELISNILLWTPLHRWAGVEYPARTYLQQLCTDTGCSLEDLLNVMDDRDEWSQRNLCS